MVSPHRLNYEQIICSQIICQQTIDRGNGVRYGGKP